MSIFDKLPPTKGELFEILYKRRDIEITHIVSSSYIPDKLYCQDTDEFVIVLEGSAVLQIEEREITLTKGEYIFIKALAKHRVLSCENGTRWLAVYIKATDNDY